MNRGIQKKKDCFGCRAYWYDGIRGHCQLHYRVKAVTISGKLSGITVPQTICPKPRTYRDLARAEVK